MTFEDFEKDSMDGYCCDWISKERFWFEGKKTSFWYRIGLIKHEYCPNWDGVVWTRYQVLLMVDDESVHESYKHGYFKNTFPTRRGYWLKEKEQKGTFNEDTMMKLVDSALKLKIENKIKENSYQKILGIVNGTTFYH